MHGLPSVVRVKGWFLKAIWLCCFIASLTYCVISIVKALKDFLDYPTQISTYKVLEIPTKFPAVTFCNSKSLDKVKAQNYIDAVLKNSDGTEKIPLENYPDDSYSYVLSNQYFVNYAVAFDNVNINDQIRRYFGFDISQMLISCQFNYAICNATDFDYFFSPLYGNCYTFNKASSKRVKEVSLGGPSYGLLMEFFVGDPDTQDRLEFSDGIFVNIHNQSILPNLNSERILVPVGFDTALNVKRKFTSRLPKPYGNCLDDTSNQSSFSSFYFDFIVKTKSIPYTQKYCFELCVQNLIVKNCGCANFVLPFLNESSTVCIETDQIDQIECSRKVINDFESIANECKDACPLECNTIDYEVSSSSLSYPSSYYQNLLANNSIIKSSGISYDNIPKAVLRLNVFYDTPQYELIEENIAISTDQFISNLGGTLGLYLGLSLLSLAEIIELFFILIHLYLKHDLEKQRKLAEISSQLNIIVLK